MTEHIAQMLDSPLRVLVNPAFATVQIEMTERNGYKVLVTLDMECAINVLRHMDNGAAAIKEIKAASPPRKWWQLW